MRSTSSLRKVATLVVGLGALLLACAACSASIAESIEPSQPGMRAHIPVFDTVGSRIKDYGSLQELAGDSSALVRVHTTGAKHDVPLPGGDKGAAPTTFVSVVVDEVYSGTVDGTMIDVVAPGMDVSTGSPALLTGGTYVLFLAPAVYGPGQPAGGYVVTGGPAGMYASDDRGTSFLKVDKQSAELPGSVNPDSGKLPRVARTAADIIAKGR